MKQSARPVLNEDENADMGVGTMIVFIAMVLVAGVAASVLINVANDLQQQAQSTADQAIANVATGFEIHDVVGDRVNSVGITSIAAGGPTVNIASSEADDEVITTAAVHRLAVGDSVTIASHDAVPSINGAQTVATVPSTTTFTLTGVDITTDGTAVGTVQIAGTLAIVTTTNPHGFSTSDSISFAGITQSTYTAYPTLNGNSHTITVVSTTTFSLASTYVNVAGTGGTATLSGLRETITFLKITVDLQAGSPNVAMENVIIEISDESSSAMLNLDTTTTNMTEWSAHTAAHATAQMNRATDVLYTVDELRDPSNTFYTSSDSDNPDFVVSQGVLLRIFIDVRAAGITISPQNTVHISLMQQNGVPSEEIFTAPESYSDQLVALA